MVERGRAVVWAGAVALVLVGGVIGFAIGAAASSGDGDGDEASGCIAVLTEADEFVDRGEGNAEIFVAQEESGDWAVDLSEQEEACGLRVREVVDRLTDGGPVIPEDDESDSGDSAEDDSADEEPADDQGGF